MAKQPGPSSIVPPLPVSVEPACGAGIQIAQRVYGLEMSDQRQWNLIEKIQNRPPAWTTVAISLLTFLLGVAVTVAVRGQ